MVENWSLVVLLSLHSVAGLQSGGSSVEEIGTHDHSSEIPTTSLTSTLFTLRGGAGAKRALHAMKSKQCHDSDMGEGLCEYIGEASDHTALMQAGFELVQLQQSSKFAGDGYHHPADLKAQFEALSTQYPNLAQVLDLTSLLNAPRTVNGNSIYALKISDNVKQDEDEPNVMLVSNHHARELVTPEVALRSAQWLLRDYTAGDQMAQKIVDQNQFYVIWTMNPDSLQAVWEGNPWIRKNSNGVDLNRNYAVGWDLPCGGSSDEQSEGYRGLHPFSEAETQTMRLLQEDRNFAKVMDLHSYAKEVRINYGCVSLPKPIHSLFMTLASSVGHDMHYDAGQSCCMGGDIHFAYKEHGSLAFLVEAGGDGFQPDSVGREAILDQMWPGAKRFLQLPIPVSGHLILQLLDGSHVAPDAAELRVPSLDFKLDEVSRVGVNGRYHLWLPAGEWEVEVKSKHRMIEGGVLTKVVKVTARDQGHTQDLVIKLKGDV